MQAARAIDLGAGLAAVMSVARWRGPAEDRS